MKKRYLLLPGAMLLAIILLTGAGAAAKYRILAPLGLGDDVDAASLPFRLATDEDFKAEIDYAREEIAELNAGTDPQSKTEPETGSGTEGTNNATSNLPTKPSHGPRPEPENTSIDGMLAGSTTELPTGVGSSTGENPSTGEQENNTQPDNGEAFGDDGLSSTPQDPPADREPSDPTFPADTQPGAPDENTEPPAASDDYSIVTGTGGEFTPGAMVDDSWFDDALFIGDSRTDGLRLYCRTGEADYFAVTGLTVFSALSKKASDKNFSSQTLSSLLSSRTYGKIFICLGLNECGSKVQNIINSYQDVINTIQTKQPGAKVIVQGVMCCGRKKANKSSSFGPENINKLNANIKTMAEDSGAYYIDPNTLFADSEGYLPDKFSGDGCHFYAKYYSIWMDWIKCSVYNIPVGSSETPADSETPAPEESAEPTEPVDPVQPAEPTEPTDPAEPAEPTEPTEPTEPAEPANSADSTDSGGGALNLT